MAYNSNKLEGSTLTEKQTASIFETGTLYKENGVEYYITKDIEEATGHFKMHKDAYTATADSAVTTSAFKHIKLKGNAKVEKGGE